VREVCAEEWRGRPARSAGDRRRVRQAHVCGKVTEGEREDNARARDGCERRDRVRLDTAAPNRYDRWDQRVSIASDESTMQKYKRRSNRRCTYAPG
jgi:hypothetical protein